MLIGSHYSDNKIYRGIRHYDHLPLLSEDIHEYADTAYMKNAYIMNNIIGYGVLNTPSLSISTSGIKMNNPSVVLIDGDISLVMNDSDNEIISIEEVASANHSSGIVCVVGWYQPIIHSSTIRNYGGVNNSILDNDLADNALGIQVSTRYQFRWIPAILSREDIENDSITLSIDNRDESGDILEGRQEITSYKKLGDVFIAKTPTSMSYSSSDIYIVPIINYEYSLADSIITEATPVLPARPKGSSGFISSESEPIGEYIDGTVWYNPINREFKTYIKGVGFVANTSKMGFLQYQSTYTIEESHTTAQDIVVPIGISEFQEGDILQVAYEGLILSLNEHYIVNYNDHTITLLGFTSSAGDKVYFTVTRIVEATDITNISTTFLAHMDKRGSATVEAHVKLSDDTDSDSDASNGVAATPKSVRDSKILKDSSSGINYRLGVENGLLYVEEV